MVSLIPAKRNAICGGRCGQNNERKIGAGEATLGMISGATDKVLAKLAL